MFGWMFGKKRIAGWKLSCAELQRQHDALAKQHDALAKKYDALNVRYNGVNQEIGELRAWIKGIEKRVDGLEGLYGGVAASHAKEIKRVSDLQEKYDDLEERHAGLAAQVLETGCRDEICLMGQRIGALEKAQRLAGRKKVRRRDPQTGRFESVYEDELESE